VTSQEFRQQMCVFFYSALQSSCLPLAFIISAGQLRSNHNDSVFFLSFFLIPVHRLKMPEAFVWLTVLQPMKRDAELILTVQ
jgi:hypothetical protein